MSTAEIINSPARHDFAGSKRNKILITIVMLVTPLLLVVLELHGASSGLNHTTDMSGVAIDLRIAKWLSLVLFVVSSLITALAIIALYSEGFTNPDKKFVRGCQITQIIAGTYATICYAELSLAYHYLNMLQ